MTWRIWDCRGLKGNNYMALAYRGELKMTARSDIACGEDPPLGVRTRS